MEPVYAATGGGPSYVSNAAWLVTALPPVDASGRAVARTFVIFDGTDIIREITRSGILDVTLSAGASPSPISTAFGLPILSIDEAIAVRVEDVTDREIAVRGYFVPAALGTQCGASFSSAINPVRLACPFDTQWLLDTPEPMDGVRSSLQLGRVGFQPLLPGLDTSLLTEAADRGLTARSLVEVVLIGHFHDRRGREALCDTADASACDGFVADGIYSVGGDLIQPSTLVQLAATAGPPLDLTWTAEDVDRLILKAVPGLQILSRVALAGSDIPALEPALGTGALGIIDRPFVWLVTGLDPGVDGKQPVRRTFLLVDGTAEAYESAPWNVSDVGFVPFHLIGLPLASEEPGPSPSSTPPGPTDSNVIGKPVTVSEAIDHRDNHLDDTEVLVRGYGWGPPGAIACTPLLVAPPALDQCPDGFSWIGERKPVGSAPEFLQPDGPAFNLLVRDWTYLGSNLSYRPRQILALGHFDDPQAEQCAPELVERCRRNFLVDALLDPARGWPADNASSPSLICADGMTIPDCAAAASSVLESLTGDQGAPTMIEIGTGVWCPTPGLLFENTSCPAGGMPPTEGGQWIGHALVTLRGSPAQAYLNISRSGSVVRAKSIASATPPPSPN
jgi:hypothetical protein